MGKAMLIQAKGTRDASRPRIAIRGCPKAGRLPRLGGATHALWSCMSNHAAQLRWRRETPDFDLKTYNRDHAVTFKNGKAVTVSAAPAYKGSPGAIDPEEMLVGSLASCHMLTFLALAAGKKFVVDSYEDDAVGVLEKNSDGRMAITKVTLRPRIAFSGVAPDAATLDELHHKAHQACFIANSVKCEMAIETPVTV